MDDYAKLELMRLGSYERNISNSPIRRRIDPVKRFRAAWRFVELLRIFK